MQIYLSEVIEWYSNLKDEQKWNEKARSLTREKLLSALYGISDHNAEKLLNRLPRDALYEEHAILLGRMNQHQLALSLYVHKVRISKTLLTHVHKVLTFVQLCMTIISLGYSLFFVSNLHKLLCSIHFQCYYFCLLDVYF